MSGEKETDADLLSIRLVEVILCEKSVCFIQTRHNTAF